MHAFFLECSYQWSVMLTVPLLCFPNRFLILSLPARCTGESKNSMVHRCPVLISAMVFIPGLSLTSGICPAFEKADALIGNGDHAGNRVNGQLLDDTGHGVGW